MANDDLKRAEGDHFAHGSLKGRHPRCHLIKSLKDSRIQLCCRGWTREPH